jgi:hypothetical protein
MSGELLPKSFALEQNYPNPFNPSTTIKYELPRTSKVTLTVYDLLGREVSVLVNERREAGVYEVKFDGSNLASERKGSENQNPPGCPEQGTLLIGQAIENGMILTVSRRLSALSGV